VSKIQYQIGQLETKFAQLKSNRNDYKALETRRGLLQRWRQKLDEYEMVRASCASEASAKRARAAQRPTPTEPERAGERANDTLLPPARAPTTSFLLRSLARAAH
jgi:hypothetical protein